MVSTPGTIGRRIVVIGTTCAGKTTLARALGEKLGIPHVELDALYWGPGWEALPTEAFRSAVADALSGETWTTDGNYSKVQDIIWGRADTLIWLDYAFPVIMGRPHHAHVAPRAHARGFVERQPGDLEGCFLQPGFALRLGYHNTRPAPPKHAPAPANTGVPTSHRHPPAFPHSNSRLARPNPALTIQNLKSEIKSAGVWTLDRYLPVPARALPLPSCDSPAATAR